jgi:PTH1 family peptidyl-tRNA hydrolase
MEPAAIIGLGNPGVPYRETRHNLGFMVVEELARRWSVPFRPGRGPYEVSLAREPRSERDVILVAPRTFMNLSGEAVSDVSCRYGVTPGSMLVVVDDFWLPLGILRYRPRGSDGGHHGLASIIAALESEEFPRLRLGIGKAVMPPKQELADFVLSAFDPEERALAADMVLRAADAAEDFVRSGRALPRNPPGPEDGENAG